MKKTLEKLGLDKWSIAWIIGIAVGLIFFSLKDVFTLVVLFFIITAILASIGD